MSIWFEQQICFNNNPLGHVSMGIYIMQLKFMIINLIQYYMFMYA